MITKTKYLTKDKKELRNQSIYNYYRSGLSVKELARKYKMSESNISYSLKSYNPDYCTKNYCNRWTNKEIIYLIDNYSTMTAPQLSLKLNKPIKTIYNKALGIGLFKHNTQDKIKSINALFNQGLSVKQIASRLNITVSRVYQVRKIGVK